MSTVVHTPKSRQDLASGLVGAFITLMAALYTLFMVVTAAIVAVGLLVGDFETHYAYRYRNTTDEPWHAGFGLIFSGASGIAWASVLAAGTAIAFVLALTPWVWVRRAACVALVGHAALWELNTLYMLAISSFAMFWWSAIGHTVAFAFIAAFVTRKWKREATTIVDAPQTRRSRRNQRRRKKH